MMRIGRFYRETAVLLQQAGIEGARNDAAQLFEHVLGIDRNRIFLHPEDRITEEQESLLQRALDRRLAREPLQYITSIREFWSLDFAVSPAVLIPRPETEFLIDRVLAAVRDSGFTGGPVLDMCTGSGVIAVVAALELEAETVIAVDRSPAALRVAAGNVTSHVRPGRIHLVCADLFSGLRPDPVFEIIIANPPYIADAEYSSLQPEVRDWEPKSALLAGEKGLDVIREICLQAPWYMQPGAWLFIEIGADQEQEVYALFTEHPGSVYEHVAVLRDWTGRPRVLQARKKG